MRFHQSRLHDTWVILKEENPLAEIIDLFPDRNLPMRDPFPLERTEREGRVIALWIIDLGRLKALQAEKIAEVYCRNFSLTDKELFQTVITYNGFPFESGYVEDVIVGTEGYLRTQEASVFFKEHPEPSKQQALDFYLEQHAKWIDFVEEFATFPEATEGFDPRFEDSETEEMVRLYDLEEKLNEYSVFDFVAGRAAVKNFNSSL